MSHFTYFSIKVQQESEKSPAPYLSFRSAPPHEISCVPSNWRTFTKNGKSLGLLNRPFMIFGWIRKPWPRLTDVRATNNSSVVRIIWIKRFCVPGIRCVPKYGELYTLLQVDSLFCFICEIYPSVLFPPTTLLRAGHREKLEGDYRLQIKKNVEQKRYHCRYFIKKCRLCYKFLFLKCLLFRKCSETTVSLPKSNELTRMLTIKPIDSSSGCYPIEMITKTCENLSSDDHHAGRILFALNITRNTD